MRSGFHIDVAVQRVVPLVAAIALVAGCRGRSPVAPSSQTTVVPIMAASRLTPRQIGAWFSARQPQPPGAFAATVLLETLTQLFVDEGAAEGVTGDVAFMQSVVETGWFRFSGSIPASSNNFAGIGATDTDPRPAVFPDARTGIRAQIQHLRAYADPTAATCTVPPLRNPCVDPRFDLVIPKGRAPTWNQMGNGNWATASTYASSILSLYDEARGFSAGVQP